LSSNISLVLNFFLSQLGVSISWVGLDSDPRSQSNPIRIYFIKNRIRPFYSSGLLDSGNIGFGYFRLDMDYPNLRKQRICLLSACCSCETGCLLRDVDENKSTSIASTAKQIPYHSEHHRIDPLLDPLPPRAPLNRSTTIVRRSTCFITCNSFSPSLEIVWVQICMYNLRTSTWNK